MTVMLRVMIHELGVLFTQEEQLSEEEMRRCKHNLKAKDKRKDGCKTQKNLCLIRTFERIRLLDKAKLKFWLEEKVRCKKMILSRPGKDREKFWFSALIDLSTGTLFGMMEHCLLMITEKVEDKILQTLSYFCNKSRHCKYCIYCIT